MYVQDSHGAMGPPVPRFILDLGITTRSALDHYGHVVRWDYIVKAS